jgi:hypothetical protein|tara:strand:- start:19 stop:351 length:333 start_codon:yes stop_codon:yes gene_type:complete
MKETIISNIRGEDEYGQPIFIDRIYGTDNTRRLIQKDGTVYGGTLTKRRITVKRLNGEGSFNSHVWETADGRWFDRGGMPIDKPEQLEKTTSEMLQEGFDEEQKQREEEE